MPTADSVQQAIDLCDNKERLVILLSHIGGIVNPEIEAISELCQQNNVVLLEDCAHSFGATLNGRHSASFGDAGVFSFYATKAVPGGEGGIIATNNSELAELCSRFVIYDRFKQEMDIGIR